eukprot:SAG31_NODE_849_length_11529_cov_3.342257_4_plen_296_part_00
MPYYVNGKTGESQYEVPTKEAKERLTLPLGWETTVSRTTGKIYYVNTWNPKESQYEFPAVCALPTGWTQALSTTDGKAYYVTPSVSRWLYLCHRIFLFHRCICAGSQGEAMWDFPTHQHPEVQLSKTESSGAPTPRAADEDPLPPGWDKVVASGTGRTFYVNVVTGQGQSVKPTSPALPDGWEVATSNTTGKSYFINSITGEISDDPPMTQAQHADLAEAAGMVDATAAVMVQKALRGHQARRMVAQAKAEEAEKEARRRRRKLQTSSLFGDDDGGAPMIMMMPQMDDRPKSPPR